MGTGPWLLQPTADTGLAFSNVAIVMRFSIRRWNRSPARRRLGWKSHSCISFSLQCGWQACGDWGGWLRVVTSCYPPDVHSFHPAVAPSHRCRSEVPRGPSLSWERARQLAGWGSGASSVTLHSHNSGRHKKEWRWLEGGGSYLEPGRSRLGLAAAAANAIWGGNVSFLYSEFSS